MASSAGTAMRSEAEQVSFSWRRMPPSTGGRGSYGHRHPGQEEIYFVISGTVTFKVGDHVFEAGPPDRGADDRRAVLLAPTTTPTPKPRCSSSRRGSPTRRPRSRTASGRRRERGARRPSRLRVNGIGASERGRSFSAQSGTRLLGSLR